MNFMKLFVISAFLIINANNVFLSVIRAVYTICIFYPRNKLYLISLLVLKNGYKYENF